MHQDGQDRVWKILIAVRDFLRHELVAIIGTGHVDSKEWSVIYDAVRIIGEEEINLSPNAHAICDEAIKDLEKDSNELLNVLRQAKDAQQTPSYDEVYWIQQVNKKHQQIVRRFEQHLNNLKQKLPPKPDPPPAPHCPTETQLTSILFLAADPSNASRLRLGEEFREIHEKLKLAKLREKFCLELPQLSVRPADMSQALLDVQPQIVHFSGHGTSTGALCLENQTGQTQLVKPDALAALFEQFANQVSCVLLNACYSETQAKAIAENIEYVIGMNQAIGDKAAIAFSIGFYQGLGAGRTIEGAYKLGCVQISLQSIPEHLTPVLIKKGQLQT